MAVPNIFANVTTSIPLSQLDTNFATAITLGNTAVYLGNTTTTLGNLTLTNVTLSSGTNNIGSTSISNGTSNVSIASSGGNIAMVTNGTTAITVDTSQNVGIGTTSPAQKLDVNGNAYFGPGISTGTGLTTGDALFELGGLRTGSGPAYIDIHSTASSDYETRILRAAGANGAFQIFNTGTGEFQLQQVGAAPFTVYTNATERMRIDSGGKVTVGSTAQTKGNLNLYGPASTQLNLYLFKNTQVEAYMGFNSSDSNLYVNTGGTFASTGVYMANGGTSWTTNSDERLKENLVPITDAITKVSSLRTVIGNFIADENKTARPFLIAQDVQAVLPEAVSTSTMNETEYLGVSYTDVIPLLVASIKELKSQNDALTARIVALETNNGA